MGSYRYGGFPPYVSVAERKKKAALEIAKRKKKGQNIQPVAIEGRVIAKTFWGKAWCDNLESYSDFENRLPRGRTYVRNGSVIDLQICKGEINALVNGSSLYKVNISIAALTSNKWKKIVNECSGQINSLIELLMGKLSKGVMEIIVHPQKGLFPYPKEMEFSCSCADWADMCKHVAAVLYGVGARFDEEPEALFNLRKVDHSELLATTGAKSLVKISRHEKSEIPEEDLSVLFGIDIEQSQKKSSVLKVKAKKSTKSKIKSSA